MIAKIQNRINAKKTDRREGFRCLQNQDRHGWECNHIIKH